MNRAEIERQLNDCRLQEGGDDPGILVGRLESAFRRLATTDYDTLVKVIGDWLLSSQRLERYQARVLTGQFKLVQLLDTLRESRDYLTNLPEPVDHLEAASVERLMDELTNVD